MGEIHQLIPRDGVDRVRSQADSKLQRQPVDAAAQVLTDEDGRLGITHAGFAMTALRHKRIEDEVWRREGNRTTLLIESGRNRDGGLVGTPYPALLG